MGSGDCPVLRDHDGGAACDGRIHSARAAEAAAGGLSDEEEHLRAYYYPEGDNPVLFTPYLLPDINMIIND